MPVDRLKDAQDLLEIDPDAATYVMNECLTVTIDVHYRVQRRWTVKAKYQLSDLSQWDPAAAALVRGVLAGGAPIAERCARLAELVDLVLAPLGGRLGDWGTAPEPWAE